MFSHGRNFTSSKGIFPLMSTSSNGHGNVPMNQSDTPTAMSMGISAWLFIGTNATIRHLEGLDLYLSQQASAPEAGMNKNNMTRTYHGNE